MPVCLTVICRPLGSGDVLAILFGNGAIRDPFGEPATIITEIQGISFQLVVYVDNGGAVTVNYHLTERLGVVDIRLLFSAQNVFHGCSVDLGGGIGHSSSRTRQSLALVKRVAVIIGILPPVDHGVADAGFSGPAGGEGDIRSQRAAENERIAFSILPAGKGVAGAGGSRRLNSRTAVCNELRNSDGSVVGTGVECDPVAGGNISDKSDITVADSHDLVRAVCLSGRLVLPADDRAVGVNLEGDAGSADGTVAVISGSDHTSVSRILEEYIVNGRILRVHIYSLVFAGQARDGTEGDFRIPACELLMFMLRRLRLIQRVTVLDGLRRDQSFTVIEIIRIIDILIRLDHHYTHLDIFIRSGICAVVGD